MDIKQSIQVIGSSTEDNSRKRIHSTYDVTQSNSNKVTSAFMGIRYIRNLVQKNKDAKVRAVSQHKYKKTSNFNDILYQNIDCKQITQKYKIQSEKSLRYLTIQKSERLDSQVKSEKLDIISQENKSVTPFLINQKIPIQNNQVQQTKKKDDIVQSLQKLENNQLSQQQIKQQQIKQNKKSNRQIFDYLNIKDTKKLKITKIFQKEINNQDSQKQISLHQNSLTFRNSMINRNSLLHLSHLNHLNNKDQDIIQIDPIANIDIYGDFFKHSNYDIFDEINSKYQKFLHENSNADLGCQEQEKLSSYVLDQNEVEYLRKQSNLPNQKRDTKKIIDLLKKTKFFVKLFPINSLNIIKNANIEFYNKNDVIFENEQIGNSIYIILSGTIETVKKSLIDENEIQTDQLFEGMNFGESDAAFNEKTALQKLYQTKKLDNIRFTDLVQLHQKVSQNDKISQDIINNLYNIDLYKQKFMNNYEDEESKQKYQFHEQEIEKIREYQRKTRVTRSYKALAAQDAILLNVDCRVFQSNMNNNTNENIDQQTHVLKMLPIFKNLDPTDLIIIASVMKRESFACNQLVIKEGEHPKKFYIIMNGIFQISKEQILTRKLRKQKEKDIKKIKIIQDPVFYNNDIQNFGYNFQQVSCTNGLHSYKQIINFGQKNQGDYFMTRALKSKLSEDNSYFDYTTVEKSKVSIICVYGTGNLLSIQCEQLQFLPSYLKELFMKLANDSQEVDDYDNTDKIQRCDNLDKLRDKTLNSEIKQMNKIKQLQ